MTNEYRYDDGYPFNIRLDDEDERQVEADEEENAVIDYYLTHKKPRSRVVIKHHGPDKQ